MSNNTKKNVSNVETTNTEDEKAVLPNQVKPEVDMETAVNEVFEETEKPSFQDRLNSLAAKIKKNQKAIAYTAVIFTVAGLAKVVWTSNANDETEVVEESSSVDVQEESTEG